MADVVGSEHGVTLDDLASITPRIAQAHEQFQKWRTSKDAIFFDYPFEAGLIAGLRRAGDQVLGSFDNLVVLGIGGSALGLRCLAGALLPPHANLMDRKQRGNIPRLFVCDNIDPDSFGTLLEMLDLKETCFNVISKSGTTTETLAQLFLILPLLKMRLGNRWKDHLYFTTDPESGPLRRFVVLEGLQSFEVPPKLGGRYSVLSAVGLFPAACVGIDIEGIIDGAGRMARLSSTLDLETNSAYRAAAIHEILYTKKGKPISIMMPYSDRLALFSDWYVQLNAESLGKAGQGQTPMKAVGTTDQHSQIQLFMEGPNNKVITFLGVEQFQKEVMIAQVMEPFEYLKGHGLSDILKASQHATAGALAHAHRPNFTITLPKVTPQAMGELFMFYEVVTALCGALYHINPFDQPGVELGKKLTKKILAGE